jgi:hypothetical protein
MKRFGPVAVAAVVALAAPVHAAETVLFTSGNWVVKRVTNAMVSFCGVSNVQYPNAALVSPQRLVFPVPVPFAGFSVKMATLPVAVQRIASPAELQAKAIYIEGTELAELARGAVVGYLVAGKAFSIDGTGFKTAADAAPARCAAPAQNTPPTPEQIDAINAQLQAKADQAKAMMNAQGQGPTTNKPATTPVANVPSTPASPTPVPPAKLGPAAPHAPVPAPPPSPGTPGTPGTITAANPNNLPPEVLLAALTQQQQTQQQLIQQQLQQMQQQQQDAQKLSGPIVNSLCPATVVSRMQALPLTNAQISAICH